MLKNIILVITKKLKKIFPLLRIGDLESVKELIEKYPDLLNQKEQGESLLHKAAAYGHLQICEYLINKGLNVDIETEKENGTPLMLATAFGNKEVLSFLLSKGADINKQDVNGVSSLHYAVSRNLEHIVTLLLDHGANRMLRDKMGRTPLDIAKKLEFKKIVRILECDY